MNAADAAPVAETFLREWLTEHHPVPPADTDPADDFALVIQRVEVEGENTLRTVFGVGMPFRFGDLRAPDRIHGALRALLDAHPAMRSLRIDVTADTLDVE